MARLSGPGGHVMILSRRELNLLKPLYALTAERPELSISVFLVNLEMRTVRVELEGTTLNVKLKQPDTAPVTEHYTSIQGVALAYNVPLAKITP